MLENKRCCFAGHSKVYDPSIVEKIVEKARQLVEEYGITDFWVGNYGAFDGYAASAVRKLKAKYPQISLSLVIPYLTKEINEYREDYYKNYDSIIMADIPETTPRNLKIIKANEFMINNSDFLISYVNYSWGGAVKTVEYAIKKKIQVVNLGSLEIET